MPSPSRYYSSNAAKTTLADSISSSATSLTLSAASNLPAQYPYTLILEKDTANEEIIEVTSLVGSSYQITRNIDSSGAKAHAVGANVEHGVSARDFTESRSHEIATTSVHGITGDVVGTSGAQTLASKTLTTPTINGATISGTFTSTATISGGTITGAIITGLATPTASSSAATKGYIDTSVTSAAASATAAATSASSASTSASSAATSAASAETSAIAAATSAASASTSASSAQTYASTMATSVSSAATSASSASTSASSALTSQTSAATSATSAAASATAAATSATSAANSATTAAASVAAIATSATAAASSATAAALSETAAATSATSAATSATSAGTQATNASNYATAASTSATNAATSASSASTSASSALTSQTAAATSAASAATSASSALTSQTAAATSAASAATSATSAATTYDDFDDRYLGSKASAPTVDNDGNTLIVGAIYWNSALNAMYVWSGSAWVQIANTTTYTAPTLGSQSIASGVTYTNINGLTINSTTIPASKTLVDTDSAQALTNKTIAIASNTLTGVAPLESPAFTGTVTGVNLTLSGDLTVNGTTTTINSTAINVNNQVVFEGTTADAFETTLTLIDPTADRTITLPNTSGTVITTGNLVEALPSQTGYTGRYLKTDGTTSSWQEVTALPSQTSNAGKYLTTDGSTASWAPVNASGPIILGLMGAY